jgi:hypothetical protein
LNILVLARPEVLEKVVEQKLKRLESYGFEVLKLRTPGYNGTKDRLILWPKWSPGRGPVMVECKAPGKQERALQEAVRLDWRARGCDVRDMVDTPEKVEKLCDTLLVEAVARWMGAPFDTRKPSALPPHIWEAHAKAFAI